MISPDDLGGVRVPGGDGSAAPRLLGASRELQDVREIAHRVARGGAKVLITGESGVGKDLVARYIHAHSPRASRPMIAVNCAGVTETLLESELFGHVRGSFTGAHRDKPGKLQMAHRGTIFLDEVGEMSLRMQALLLRFLENGEIQQVGADGLCGQADVRVIAATNRDLEELVASGTFREDLMYRLRVVHIRVPPLRERREDIRALVEHLADSAPRQMEFTPAAWTALESYRWPGNVRELHNLIEQLVWTAGPGPIDVDDLPAAMRLPVTFRPTALRERRRQLADELFAGLQAGRFTFWDYVHPLFLARDITRSDVRELLRRGLAATCGNYRAVLPLFGIADADYKRFLNFLAAHQCTVDYREFRGGRSDVAVEDQAETA